MKKKNQLLFCTRDLINAFEPDNIIKMYNNNNKLINSKTYVICIETYIA